MVAEKGHARSGLKAASANQKADAAFWGPLRLIYNKAEAALCIPLRLYNGRFGPS